MSTVADPHLAVPNDPKYVANIILDRDAFLEARERIDATRFARYYANKLRIIDQESLPKLSPDVVKEATKIAAGLPLRMEIY